ncbi:MAG: hypothetical protein IV108_07820 [Burkholderiales bacterium]|nr:hypothetical protein [Burkholderiales bacterium]
MADMQSNNRMHSDSKKRRSSFLVALLFAAGDAKRWAPRHCVQSSLIFWQCSRSQFFPELRETEHFHCAVWSDMRTIQSALLLLRILSAQRCKHIHQFLRLANQAFLSPFSVVPNPTMHLTARQLRWRSSGDLDC